ncbi:MAG TPA: DUF1569 domain-containing protein [Ferruginibacter sp.]|nr:hypothetical protein [Chitinophagaceae bacterium]HRI23635.1 DUF1569 domain-containing protein [Ferruginibacter sp.]
MKNLFNKEVYEEIIQRLNAFTASADRQWGKMEAAQMLAHCKAAFSVPLSEKKLPRSFIGLTVGWLFKHSLYNDKPWRKNLPTAPAFRITDHRNFEKEKKELTMLVDRFYTLGPGKVGLFPHPLFGSYTSDQWGQAMYKHLDHHLRQFGV